MSLLNEELYDLLEEAAENATGRGDIDIAEYVMILEDEWITDVDALQKMDSDALDEMLPLLLSRELQRLMRRGQRRTALNRNRRWRRSCTPGPPKHKLLTSKPVKPMPKELGDNLPKPPKPPRGYYKASDPPEAVPIGEDESLSSSEEQGCNPPGCSITCKIDPKLSPPSPAQKTKEDLSTTQSVGKDGENCNTTKQAPSSKDEQSCNKTEPAPPSKEEEQCNEPNSEGLSKTESSPNTLQVAPAIEEKAEKKSSRNGGQMRRKNKSPSAFCRIFDIFDHFCAFTFWAKEESNEITLDPVEEEGIDDDELQRMSNSNPFAADATKRANHLIADANRRDAIIRHTHERFPTREALEDAILEYQAIVQQEQKDAAASSKFRVKERLTSAAEDELRALYPLRLILPTIGDLTEMIGILQDQREHAMRDLDMERANSAQREIDELQSQVDKEERYLMKKQLQEVECVACGEKFTPMSEAKKKLLSPSSCDGTDAIVSTKKKERHCEKCRVIFGIEDEDEEPGSVLRRILTAATEDCDEVCDQGDVSQVSVDDEGLVSEVSLRSPDTRYYSE